MITPSISEVRLCTELVANSNRCKENETVFPQDVDRVFMSIEVVSAPKNTLLTVDWYQVVDQQSVLLTQDNIPPISQSELHSKIYYTFLDRADNNPWPIGTYEVVITSNLDEIPKKTVNFEIE